MVSTPHRLRILSVGGNSVSAFISWRLQATNACDVTLVWKSAFEAVAQYGISFKSLTFGNERFKPHHVVRTPDEAATIKDSEAPFDYVLLCVKALTDVYDLAAVIESVVTPQHTCILVNTTHTLGVEAHLEQRFPTNVVLSLVSGAELAQLGVTEFEHKASTEIWIGAANKSKAGVSEALQHDMAETLAMTLTIGQVDCKVSHNIRQQQFERMIGPIAFHPLSVLFELPNHALLMERVGVRPLISDAIDELLQVAEAYDCTFPPDFKEKTLESMHRSTETNSIMYQDFMARRPMEVETYLGSPIKLAQSVGIKIPRIETLYALLHNANIVNQQRPREAPIAMPVANGNSPFPPRFSTPQPRLPNGMTPNSAPSGMMNGMGRGRARNLPVAGPSPGMRRGPPMNGGSAGYGRPMPGGYGPPPGRPGVRSRRGSVEHELGEEFNHLALFDGEIQDRGSPMPEEMRMREREMMIRQREMALREREMRMRMRPASTRAPTPSTRNGGFDEDDDDDDYVDPSSRPAPPLIDPDNFDMMSMTSRRSRKIPSASQVRNNPEGELNARMGGGRRPLTSRNRASARMVGALPSSHNPVMDDMLMGYSSNRYGAVDRQSLGQESRAASLTSARLDELQMAGGGMNGPYPRRASQSPGNPYGPQAHRSYGNSNSNGASSNNYEPPGGARQPPTPQSQHAPGPGSVIVPPAEVKPPEQHVGVSAPAPPRKVNRSLTGSASASAKSGNSARIEPDESVHSSQNSVGALRPAA